ncbi:MAG TPA: GNAT family N-acetyltransferase [Spirochaetia bacterium]|nr:GNAT family N-acetyltransferase [Spirochaetia bacterium]
MNVGYIRLLSARRNDLFRGHEAPAGADDLHRLSERRGERIAAVDPETERLLGWISLYPDRDAGGRFFALAGIEVLPAWRGKGIGTGLIRQAEAYLRERKVTRLKFGTSPLLTWCAGLYMRRFGMRYTWKEGVRTPEGKPWPFVSCEWDLDDPAVKPPDLREKDLPARSAIDWKGPVPVRRSRLVYSEPLFVPLPDLSNDELAGLSDRAPDFLPAIYRIFQDLFRHGYRFSWFDMISAASFPGCCCFYFMENPLAL